MPIETEQAVVALAIDQPAWGQVREHCHGDAGSQAWPGLCSRMTSLANIALLRSSGRGRLPVWVVKKRSNW
jgi:hypothetical protein